MALFPAIILVSLFLLVVLIATLRRLKRAFIGRRSSGLEAFAPRVCPCGYDLSKLDRARCPECGRVRFFDATPEELGLSDEELRRLTEAQNRREAEKRAKQLEGD